MELLRDLRAQELWHQLSEAVEEFISARPFDHEEFCRSFLFGVETHFNRVSWALIAGKIAKGVKDSVAFLTDVRRRFREKEASRDAWLLLTIALAQAHLRAGHGDEVDELLKYCRDMLGLQDPNIPIPVRQGPAVKDVVLSLYYEVLAEQAQLNNDAITFYRHSLHYLSYTPIESIPIQIRQQLAFSLGVAALLGKDLYSFGELLVHPIFDSLLGTPLEWMHRLLSVFNEGNLQKYEQTVELFKDQLKSQPSLLQNHHILRDKIRLASFISLVFTLPADQRLIPFATIAQHTKLADRGVEFLVIKALALGLIRGSINQIEQTVRVDYVQPRMLAPVQIQQMKDKLLGWSEKVAAGLRFLDAETASLAPV